VQSLDAVGRSEHRALSSSTPSTSAVPPPPPAAADCRPAELAAERRPVDDDAGRDPQPAAAADSGVGVPDPPPSGERGVAGGPGSVR